MNHTEIHQIDPLPEAMAAFVPELRDRLAALGEEAPLIVSIWDSYRYIQYATFDGKANLRAESVSNQYLYDGELLNGAELLWLRNHGWNEPDEGGNYWRHWEPADHTVAALVGVVTLHLIHGVTTPEQLFVSSESPCEIAGLDWSAV